LRWERPVGGLREVATAFFRSGHSSKYCGGFLDDRSVLLSAVSPVTWIFEALYKLGEAAIANA
jgi:hypothetical protein